MHVFKVTYEYVYPTADDDFRVAYVLAESFEDAIEKVEKRYKGEHESASVKNIELLEADIIV